METKNLIMMLIILGFITAGCANTNWYQRTSSRVLSCPASKIEVSDKNGEWLFKKLEDVSWTSKCKGRTYYCTAMEAYVAFGAGKFYKVKCGEAIMKCPEDSDCEGNWYQRVSSYLGCPPSEIQISEEDRWGYLDDNENHRWVAKCGEKTYSCKAILNKDFFHFDYEISCDEKE